jgi:transaldolase
MSLKNDVNFSLWCDFIERDFLENEFKELLKANVIHGATSNPAIFEQSISSSDAYTQQITMLQANDTKKIYEELAITDIKRAANIMDYIHEENNNDGFISIEVDPTLCDNSEATIEEGIRLNTSISYENVMIKVPATPSGYLAMEKLTSLGINVNATLVFSVEQAIQCTKALNSGIKQSSKDTKAVVSVFVSRFDRVLDEKLKELGLETSQVGIVNATACYHEVEKFGNANIRTLFASTGVKGNEISPSYYIDNLLFPNSINTAPLGTIKEYLKDEKNEISNIKSLDECNEYFAKLEASNIKISNISDTLLTSGLDAFKISFAQMLKKLKKDN